MGKTRGQQEREQPPVDVGGVALRGVTGEGDTVTTTVYSGSALKYATPLPCSGSGASTLQGMRADGESTALQSGTGSPTLRAGTCDDEHNGAKGLNIPRNVGTHHLGAVPHSATGAEVAGSLMEGELITLWAGLVAPPVAPSLVLIHKDTPACQHVVFGDLSGRVTGVNLYLHQDMPALFGLQAPVQAELVQARALFVMPEAAALTLALPIPNAMTGARVLWDAGHGGVAKQEVVVDGIDDPPFVGEPASPWACHQEHAHKLSADASNRLVEVAILRRASCLSRLDWCEASARPAPAPPAQAGKYFIATSYRLRAARPYAQLRLTQMARRLPRGWQCNT